MRGGKSPSPRAPPVSTCASGLVPPSPLSSPIFGCSEAHSPSSVPDLPPARAQYPADPELSLNERQRSGEFVYLKPGFRSPTACCPSHVAFGGLCERSNHRSHFPVPSVCPRIAVRSSEVLYLSCRDLGVHVRFLLISF